MLWDRGTWMPKGDPDGRLREGPAQVRRSTARSCRAAGCWCAATAASTAARSKLAADQGERRVRAHRRRRAIVDDGPKASRRGRSLEEIAADPDRVWHSNKSVAENVQHAARVRSASAKPALDARQASTARARRRSRTRSSRSSRRSSNDAPDGRRVAARDQVRRLPHAVPHRRGEVRHVLAQRQGLDRAASARSPRRSRGCRSKIGVARRRGRRRSTPTGRTQLPGAAERAVATRRPTSSRYFVFDLLVPRRLRPARRAAARAQARCCASCSSATARTCATAITSQGNGRRRSSQQACKLRPRRHRVQARATRRIAGARSARLAQGQMQQRQEMVIGGFTDPQGSAHRLRRAAARRLRATASCAMRARSAPASTTRRCASCAATLDSARADGQPRSSIRRAAAKPRARTGSSRSWSPKSRSPSGRDDGTLRHPSFQGLREDKNATRRRARAAGARSASAEPAPTSVRANGSAQARRATAAKASAPRDAKPADRRNVAPQAQASDATDARSGTNRRSKRAGSTTDAASRSAAHDDTVAGVELSNPDKLLYPEAAHQARSRAVLRRDRRTGAAARRAPAADARALPERLASAVLLPEARDRRRRGRSSASRSGERRARRTYMMANSVGALVALVQMGVLEIASVGLARRRRSTGPTV